MKRVSPALNNGKLGSFMSLLLNLNQSILIDLLLETNSYLFQHIFVNESAVADCLNSFIG